MDIDKLARELRVFAAERDWDQFHSPKNLCMALSVEVAELLEHFQWLSEAESRALPEDMKAAAAEEIADVQIYLVRLADKLGVDIGAAVNAKLESNRRKYPADLVRGRAAKYTAYEEAAKAEASATEARAASRARTGGPAPGDERDGGPGDERDRGR